VSNPFSELPLDRFKIEDSKPIFVFNEATELAFLKAACDWSFPIHFTLAKTGLRVGELTHLLVDDVVLEGGWLHIRNKTQLGWRIKSGHERAVPLLPEVVAVLRSVIGSRKQGPVFLREKLADKAPKLVGNRIELEAELQERISAARATRCDGRTSRISPLKFGGMPVSCGMTGCARRSCGSCPRYSTVLA
jgi:integrase